MFFFFKQKTAYEIKECDWSSDVCSSDLLIKTGFSSSIRLLAQQDIKVDMIFADPPYYKDKNNSHLSQKCLNNIAEYKILKDSGMVILEHYAQDKISIPAGLVLFKQKEYGDTTISFCKNKKILAIINTL